MLALSGAAFDAADFAAALDAFAPFVAFDTAALDAFAPLFEAFDAAADALVAIDDRVAALDTAAFALDDATFAALDAVDVDFVATDFGARFAADLVAVFVPDFAARLAATDFVAPFAPDFAADFPAPFAPDFGARLAADFAAPFALDFVADFAAPFAPDFFAAPFGTGFDFGFASAAVFVDFAIVVSPDRRVEIGNSTPGNTWRPESCPCPAPSTTQLVGVTRIANMVLLLALAPDEPFEATCTDGREFAYAIRHQYTGLDYFLRRDTPIRLGWGYDGVARCVLATHARRTAVVFPFVDPYGGTPHLTIAIVEGDAVVAKNDFLKAMSWDLEPTAIRATKHGWQVDYRYSEDDPVETIELDHDGYRRH